MGCFSYGCAVCDQEILGGEDPGYSKFNKAIVLWPNGDRISGEYDGFGRIGGIENLAEQHGGWKIVHQSCYQGQAFDTLSDGNNHADHQGCWPGERMAVEFYGEPNLSELKREKTYVCNMCLRTWKAKWSGGKCMFGCVRPKNYLASEESIASKWFLDLNEMVEPFHWISGDYETANGLIRCHNEHEESTDWQKYHSMSREERDKNPPKKIAPCLRYGDPTQARVTKPEEWDEFTREDRGEFVVRCASCKSDNVEILVLNGE